MPDEFHVPQIYKGSCDCLFCPAPKKCTAVGRQTASNASKSTRRSMGSGQILGTTSVNMSSTGNADADDQLKELVYSSPGV